LSKIDTNQIVLPDFFQANIQAYLASDNLAPSFLGGGYKKLDIPKWAELGISIIAWPIWLMS
jgi:hypothetical protein